MSPRTTSSPVAPPRSIHIAIACIWAVVALGLVAVVFIFTLHFDEYRSEVVPLILGQTITVIIPAALTVFIARAAAWARATYLLLSVIGVTLRLLGLSESVSSGSTVISALQAGSIVLTLTAAVLLCSRTARAYVKTTPRGLSSRGSVSYEQPGPR